MQRIKLYSQISTSLACLSNEKLKQILADGKPMHEGIGGKSALISINDTPVFVKKVPLTDLEQLPQHFMSTENFFDLTAVVFVEEQLKTTNKHMNTRSLMHFDAHFKNILTDGNLIYLSDFGLALSSKFDLTLAETDFLKQHQSYDQACAAVNLLHCIITSLFGKEHWAIRLREYLIGELNNVPPAINTIINRYAPIALLMDEFFQKLQKESKSTPYPATQVEKLLRTISSEIT
jgi:hypothetical protein